MKLFGDVNTFTCGKSNILLHLTHHVQCTEDHPGVSYPSC